MSDARLIKKVGYFGTADGTDDLEEPEDYERWAKAIIKAVRDSDRRRRARKTWRKIPHRKLIKQPGL